MEYSISFARGISSFTRPNNTAGFPAVGIGKWKKKKVGEAKLFGFCEDAWIYQCKGCYACSTSPLVTPLAARTYLSKCFSFPSQGVLLGEAACADETRLLRGWCARWGGCYVDRQMPRCLDCWPFLRSRGFKT